MQGQWPTLEWASQTAAEETGPLALILQDGKPVLQLCVERGPTPAEAPPGPCPVPKPCRLANARPSLVCELGPQDGVCVPACARISMTSARSRSRGDHRAALARST